jgi:tetratricopeptide (TPR) repeat protein
MSVESPRGANSIGRRQDDRSSGARTETIDYSDATFIQRHRAGVAAALLVAVAIVATLLAAFWQARQTRLERDLAGRIDHFLQDALGAAGIAALGSDAKMAEVLAHASSRAQTELANEPEVRAGVLLMLGKAYVALARYEPAELTLRAALDASLKANGPWHPTTAATMGWLGLALANRNKAGEGERLSRQAVAILRKAQPPKYAELGAALYALGLSLSNKREPKTAQPFLREASELSKRDFGETDDFYVTTLLTLAMAHERASEVGAAESVVRGAIAGAGSRPRAVLAQAQTFLGFLLTTKGAYLEAETLLRQSEAIYREVYGSDGNDRIGAVKADLGTLYLLKGDFGKAESESREALELLRENPGPELSVTANALATLGLALTREGDAAEGEPFLREALELRTKAVPLDSFLIPFTESALGECLTAQQRYAEAESFLTDGYTGLIWKLGEKDVRTTEARQRLAKLYESWGKPEQAQLFR